MAAVENTVYKLEGRHRRLCNLLGFEARCPIESSVTLSDVSQKESSDRPSILALRTTSIAIAKFPSAFFFTFFYRLFREVRLRSIYESESLNVKVEF